MWAFRLHLYKILSPPIFQSTWEARQWESASPDEGNWRFTMFTRIYRLGSLLGATPFICY